MIHWKSAAAALVMNAILIGASIGGFHPVAKTQPVNTGKGPAIEASVAGNGDRSRKGEGDVIIVTDPGEEGLVVVVTEKPEEEQVTVVLYTGDKFPMTYMKTAGGNIQREWAEDNSYVTLTAVPDAGYHFAFWAEEYDDGTISTHRILAGDATNPVRVINHSMAVIAYFQKDGEHFVFKTGTYGGSFEVSSQGICAKAGQTVTITATANENFRVGGIQTTDFVQREDRLLTTRGAEWQELTVTPVTSNPRKATASFVMPDHDVWVSSTFLSTIPRKVTLTSEGDGTFTFEDGTTEKYFCEGDVVKLNVVPGDNMILRRIDGAPGNYDPETDTFTMIDKDLNIHGTFRSKRFYVYANTNAWYMGDVEIEAVNSGQGIVGLHAYPADGYQFVGWYDEDTEQMVSDQPHCEQQVERETHFCAHFEPKKFNVVVDQRTAHGTVTFDPAQDTFDYQSDVKVIATPDEGYVLDRLEVGPIVNGVPAYANLGSESFKIVLVTDYSVYAHFVPIHTVSVSTADSAMGSVSGGCTVKDGTSVTVTASPAVGYEFVNWTKNGVEVSTSSSYSFALHADTDLQANFRIKKYEIKTSVNISGSGTASGKGTFEHGQTVNLKAKALVGYDFVNWTVNGTEVSTSAEYTFEATANVTVQANFAAKQYTVSAEVGEGEGTVNGAGTYDYNTTATVSATPAEGYEFVCWTKNGQEVSDSAEYSFTVKANVSLNAEFAKMVSTTVITSQPKNTTVSIGKTAEFSVEAGGDGLTYQWQAYSPKTNKWTNSGAASAKTPVLKITATAAHNGFMFRCVITDDRNLSITSEAATLTVPAGPTITTQPSDVSAVAGKTAKFTVAATGTGTLTYQWQAYNVNSKKWVNSSAASATTANLAVTASAAINGFKFRCVITDGNGGETTSAAATLTVTAAPPTITKQPVAKSVTAGTSAAFSVTATGTGTLSYQWQAYNPNTKKWVNSSSASATTANFSIKAQEAHNGFKFRCIVTDGNGNSTTSNAAGLTVTAAVVVPKITAQPVAKTVGVGSTASFSVTATGVGTLTYQWQAYNPNTKKWVNSSSASAKTVNFSITAQTAHHNFKFRCVVTDGNGKSATSNEALLTVRPGIVTQPSDVSVSAGSSVKLSISAKGVGTITYQWQVWDSATSTWKNSSAASAKTANFTFTAQKGHNGKKFRCVLTDSNGNQTVSRGVTVTVK